MKALEERVEGELIENRRGAIRLAVTLGRQLQTDMPIIADKYRNGMFAREIVEEHGITKRYNASSSVAIAAVRYAISGYKGDSSCPAYEGLIKNQDNYNQEEQKTLPLLRQLFFLLFYKTQPVFQDI